MSGTIATGMPSRAFTLIELMVVLALIGILTAMIIPEMRGTYEDALLRSSGRELVNVFSLASSRAVTINQTQRVHLDPDSGRYVMERRVRAGQAEDSFAPVKDVAGSQGKIDARVSMDVHRPVENVPGTADQGEAAAPAAQEQMSIMDRSIDFYSDGTADSREVILRDRSGHQLALRIDSVTARVNIVELERQ